jgi:KDO2-lipid IV(A) lauroyltransferase
MRWHLAQALAYVAARWTMAWLEIAGWEMGQRVGRALGLVLGRLLPGRRRTARANLQSAGLESDSTVERMFEHLGRFAAEFALTDLIRRRRLIRRIFDVQRPEFVREALSRGRGAVLSIGHLGNWELAAMAFCDYFGLTLHSVYRPLDYPPFDRLVLRLRRRTGMEPISNDQALPGIVRALKRNGVVAMLTDQDARSDGIFVDFFGRPASTLPTPAVLSLRLGTPIVPVELFRDGRRHVARFDSPIYPEAFSGRPDPRAEITQELARRLEEFIRRHPAQWFWLHRRWKTRPT